MGEFTSKEYNKVRRKGKKEFIVRPTVLPVRKVLRMRAKHNMLKEGLNLHKTIKGGHFAMWWKGYAAK